MTDIYEGIVLKSINYSESDKIIHILTREKGKLTCIAKGIRKMKKKDVNVELFSHSFFQLYKGRGFYHVNQTESISSNFKIREDIEKLSYASFITEIADLGLMEEEENPKAFELLSKTLSVLSKGEADYLKLLVSYQLKFISFIGYKPELKKCISCGDEEFSHLNYFSNAQGGVLCNKCKELDKYSIYMDRVTHRGVYMLLYSKYEDLKDIDLSTLDIKKIQEMVLNYLKQHTERQSFKSLEFLKSLNLI